MGKNTPSLRDREPLLIELRSQGVVNHEIARRLGLRPSTIAQYCSKMIKEGRLPKMKTGPKSSLDEKKLIDLYAQDLTYVEIARVLEVSVCAVQSAYSRLIRQGKLVKRAPKLAPPYQSRKRERDQEIIRLRRAGYSWGSIGGVLSISKQRVHQIAAVIIREQGEAAFALDDELCALSSAAVELGISYELLVEICDEHGFPVIRGKRWFLQRSDLKRVKSVIQSRSDALDKPRRELEERVIKLRNQKLSINKIARDIGHTVTATRRLCSRLIRAGKLQRLAPARKWLTESERREREFKIIRWRLGGYSQSKIAQELGVSQTLVSRLCALLVKQGKL